MRGRTTEGASDATGSQSRYWNEGRPGLPDAWDLVTHSPWWKGERGEWYVAVQGVLIAMVLFAPRTLPGWPEWTPLYGWIATVFGW